MEKVWAVLYSILIMIYVAKFVQCVISSIKCIKNNKDNVSIIEDIASIVLGFIILAVIIYSAVLFILSIL